MIRSLRDINEAYEKGQWHLQRFIKTGSGQNGDTHWQDWAYQAGQPAYDSRIGAAGVFTPAIATGNDAIYFPPISAEQERVLVEWNLNTSPSSTAQTSNDAILYDLLGYYPLIDGDSTDPQLLTNTLSLPRYADGLGVFPLLVNHVAPMVQTASYTMEYVNSNGVTRTVAGKAMNTGVNRISGSSDTAFSLGNFSMALFSGDTGVRAVNSIQFTIPPGGLFCIYLVRSLTTIITTDSLGLAGFRHQIEKNMAIHNGFNFPRIYDGAHLGFFYRNNGSGRLNTFYGHLTFAWN